MFKIRDPDITLVQERLSYDPETGVFTWRNSKTMSNQWNGKWAGKPAGTIRVTSDRLRQYVLISLNKNLCMAHRLAWILTYGKLPEFGVDHFDGNGLNNRISNLREADKSCNGMNSALSRANTSEATGVYRDTRRNGWMVKAVVRGKQYHGGYFKTKEAAILAAKTLRATLGFSENHGKPREDR